MLYRLSLYLWLHGVLLTLWLFLRDDLVGTPRQSISPSGSPSMRNGRSARKTPRLEILQNYFCPLEVFTGLSLNIFGILEAYLWRSIKFQDYHQLWITKLPSCRNSEVPRNYRTAISPEFCHPAEILKFHEITGLPLAQNFATCRNSEWAILSAEFGRFLGLVLMWFSLFLTSDLDVNLVIIL